MLLVHGLLRGTDSAVLAHARTGRIRARAVVAGELAAVVSTAPEQELTPEDAVAHLDLLVALVARVPVLPLPLGTAVGDDDAVRTEVLAPAADRLEQQLAAVADLIELRVELMFDTDAVVADIARGDPEIARLADVSRAPGAGLAERMALGEAVAARLIDAETALAVEWTAELAGIAERSASLRADEQVHRAAYLVRRDRIAEADAAVERLRAAAEGRAAVEYVGPLPVYSFLDDLPASPERAPSSRWGW